MYILYAHICFWYNHFSHKTALGQTFTKHLVSCFSLASQEFDYVEFYAGKGNLSRCMRASGIRTASLDLLYRVKGSERHHSNCMDILSPAGFWNLGFKMWNLTVKSLWNWYANPGDASFLFGNYYITTSVVFRFHMFIQFFLLIGYWLIVHSRNHDTILNIWIHVSHVASTCGAAKYIADVPSVYVLAIIDNIINFNDRHQRI